MCEKQKYEFDITLPNFKPLSNMEANHYSFDIWKYLTLFKKQQKKVILAYQEFV